MLQSKTLSWDGVVLACGISCASKFICKGGVIVYRGKEGFLDVLVQMTGFVAAGVKALFDEGVGAILRHALLLACRDPIFADDVVFCRISDKSLHTAELVKLKSPLEDGYNPIEKLEVVHSESQEGIIDLSGKQDNFRGVLFLGVALAFPVWHLVLVQFLGKKRKEEKPTAVLALSQSLLTAQFSKI